MMNNPENERNEERKDQQNSIGGDLSDAELLGIAYEAGLIDLDNKYLAKPINIVERKENGRAGER